MYLLSHRPGVRLTEVALACGFSSSSDFSRNFRAHFGIAPRDFDLERFREAGREAMQARLAPALGGDRLKDWRPGENPDRFEVRIREVPARRVAYLRVQKAAGGDVKSTAARLVGWARERGLAGGQWLGFQWDDPEIVPLAQCRYDVGLEVPASAAVDDSVSVIDFPAMTLAEVEIAGPIDLELRALYWLYGTWLPTSDWAPDHQPCFEAWKGEPFADGTSHFALRIQLAVVDATRPL